MIKGNRVAMKNGPDTPDGVFEWQFSDEHNAERYAHFKFDESRYWGGFRTDLDAVTAARLPQWAIGPFVKHPANPVLAPTPAAWDKSRYGGGVHNGAPIIRDGMLHYVYRGETAHAATGPFNYICDIGLATSPDGIRFTKDMVHSPFFRSGDDARYSFEDVNIARCDGLFYLFCNRWDWEHFTSPQYSGVFLATSPDLVHWRKRGLVFPKADSIHRNPVVLQNSWNEAVRVDGRFVMYLNEHMIAYSDDMMRWESRPIHGDRHWPGGEGCAAVVKKVHGLIKVGYGNPRAMAT